MEMKALSLKYSNPVLSQIQGCAIFLRYWVKLLNGDCFFILQPRIYDLSKAVDCSFEVQCIMST